MLPSSVCRQRRPDQAASAAQDSRSYTTPWGTIQVGVIRRSERIFRALTWCAVIALAILSWTPGDYMIRPGWGHHLEHVSAYLDIERGCLAGLRAPDRLHPGREHCFAGTRGSWRSVRIGSPGRTPAFDDFAASAIGTLFGVTLTWLWLTYRPQRGTEARRAKAAARAKDLAPVIEAIRAEGITRSPRH